jgi:hypothetical protein
VERSSSTICLMICSSMVVTCGCDPVVAMPGIRQ